MFWFFKHQFDGEGFPLGPKPTERLPTYRYPFFHIVLEHRLMLRLGVHKLAAVPDRQTPVSYTHLLEQNRLNGVGVRKQRANGER